MSGINASADISAEVVGEIAELDEGEPDIDSYNLQDMEDMASIKWLLQSAAADSQAGVPFNTNILRIALNEREEKIAMILVAYYEVEIEEAMIIRAIKTR